MVGFAAAMPRVMIKTSIMQMAPSTFVDISCDFQLNALLPRVLGPGPEPPECGILAG